MKILIYSVLIVSLFIVFLRFLESRSIFFPHKQLRNHPNEFALTHEDVILTTKDGLKIHGWYFAHPEAQQTFLFFHGNAGNISDRLSKISLLHQMGYHVFIIDYRGYGLSQGRPSEKGLYIDAQTAYQYLVEEKGVSPKDIVSYGVSLGGVVAIDLASKEEVGSLIVDATLTNAKEMGKLIYPWAPAFLVQSDLGNDRKITQIQAPKLILHSVEDELIPVEMGRKLYEVAPEPKKFVELRGGHNDNFVVSQDEYIQAISAFIQQYH